MGYFPLKLRLECLLGEESKFRFKVVDWDFVYVTDDKETIVVPIDFKTDLASAPWFFSRIIPSSGRYNEAVVIHDYLCYLANRKQYDRNRADRILLEASAACGVGRIRKTAMYFGVRFYTKLLWKEGEYGA